MDLFSSSPIVESFPANRFPSSPDPSPTREADLPIDVDRSFNTSLLISCQDASPTPSASQTGKIFSGSPLPKGSVPRRPDPVPIQRKGMSPAPMMGTTGKSRAFGREISLNVPASPRELPFQLGKGKKVLSSNVIRGSFPMLPTRSNDETCMPRSPFNSAKNRRDTAPLLSPQSVQLDLMDVDSPLHCSIRGSPAPSSLSASPGLGSFFCDSPAPPSSLNPAKRRSIADNSPASPTSSPSAKRPLLSARAGPSERAQSSGNLFGQRPAALATKRTQPFKRPPPLPTLSTVVDRSSASSAYPILCGTATLGGFPKSLTAPMRRAFSVCDQQGHADDEDGDHEDSPSTSAHAEYARRHGQTYQSRVDGSPGFKPTRSSYAASPLGDSPTSGRANTSQKKISPMAPGLPGFGDEMNGKILPCHKVKEDGLARITPETLDSLLRGEYAGKLKRYHMLDCRFDYEYNGGHIDGAIHVKSMEALEELLLVEGKGVHADGQAMPRPSRSGEDEAEQVVLVFHCEFSAKRAPTFAKHLRSRDRMLNNNLYPKVFYPEVYILEGGYSEFYKTRPHRCEPQGYVPMDDPQHFERRNSDLHDFRKFARTRSFTYGETAPPIPARPACPPLAFAAASAAIGRRHGLTIAEEDPDMSYGSGVNSGSAPSAVESSPESNGSPGNHDSPCPGAPRVASLGFQPVFGSARPRQLARGGFQRVASYAGTSSRQ